MLYFVPVSIGNIDDITLRAMKLLSKIDYIICENKSRTWFLFQQLQIARGSKFFLQYTSQTSPYALKKITDIISYNNACFVSDSWMPGISDPGKNLLFICQKNQISYTVLPWPNALLPAVVASWFPTHRFLFVGFLPLKKWRQKLIRYIVQSSYPVFCYESVHRMRKLLDELYAAWFRWQISIAREISKMHEQRVTWSIDDIISEFTSKSIPEKWEFVVGISSQDFNI